VIEELPSDQSIVAAKLDRLGALIFARDPTVVDELWCDLGFTMYGSEQGERAESRDDLVALFSGLFAKPYRIAFKWQAPTVSRHADLIWACAFSTLEIVHPGHVQVLPYRLVCILQHVDGDWRWRLFDGSEPANPPVS